MIDGAYVLRMARYNRWQNENLYSAADRLSESERQRERGAFWGSIHKTLNHLLWGDQMWMSRLTGSAPPPVGIADSASLHAGWAVGVAAGLVLYAKPLVVRIAALLYPAAVILTILATGNHFVLDALAGIAVMALGFGMALIPRCCGVVRSTSRRGVEQSGSSPGS